jgi:hypothetical protein
MAGASLPETEQFEAAVEEGVAMVEAGDRPVVAADYLGEQHGLEHRVDELLAVITSEVEE